MEKVMKLLGHTQHEIVNCATTPPGVAQWVAADDPELYADEGFPNWLVETPEDVDEYGLLGWAGSKTAPIPADVRLYEFACELPGGEFINMTEGGGAAFFIPRAIMDAVPELWTEFRKVCDVR